MGWQTTIRLEVHLTKINSNKSPELFVKWIEEHDDSKKYNEDGNPWYEHRLNIISDIGDHYFCRKTLRVEYNIDPLHFVVEQYMRCYYDEAYKYFLLNMAKKYFGEKNILYARTITDVDGYVVSQLDYMGVGLDKICFNDIEFGKYGGQCLIVNKIGINQITKKIQTAQYGKQNIIMGLIKKKFMNKKTLDTQHNILAILLDA